LVDLNRGYSEELLRRVFVNRLVSRETKVLQSNVVKLGLQYLSFQDYVERNLRVFEVESNNMIKNLIDESIAEMGPIASDGGVKFNYQGTSRMGLGIEKIEVKKIVNKTLNLSSSIIIDLTVDLRKLSQPVRDEWDNEVRFDDAMILVTLPSQQGTVSSVVQVADIQGNVVGPGQVARDVLVGDKRVISVSVSVNRGDDLPIFHCVVRVKDSHFKFKLSNLQRLLTQVNTSLQLPEFINDMVLGYGDPQTASSVLMTSENPISVKISSGDIIRVPDQVPIELRAIAFGLCPGVTLISGSDRLSQVSRLIESAVVNEERILLISKYNETLQSVLSQLTPELVGREFILRPAGSVDDPFGQYRVINHILKLRLQLLADVGSLAISMGLKRFGR
jgi:hypothetical protein